MALSPSLTIYQSSLRFCAWESEGLCLLLGRVSRADPLLLPVRWDKAGVILGQVLHKLTGLQPEAHGSGSPRDLVTEALTTLSAVK